MTWEVRIDKDSCGYRQKLAYGCFCSHPGNSDQEDGESGPCAPSLCPRLAFSSSDLALAKRQITDLQAYNTRVVLENRDIRGSLEIWQEIETVLSGLDWIEIGTAFNAILTEYRAACAKHPTFPSDPFQQLSILGEEFGEAQQACNDLKWSEGSPDALRKELSQTGAMALRCLVNLPDTQIAALAAVSDTQLKEFAEDSARIEDLVAQGHPNHCAQRQVLGDGECECGLVAAGEAQP